MIVWKLIGILQKFPRIWSRLGEWLRVSNEWDDLPLYRSALEDSLMMEKKRNTIDSSFQGKVGFRNIMKVNWKSPLGSPSFFLPCQVPLDLSLSLSHLRSLSFLN
ncbi:MAG: hypothetical protein COS40_02490 [Deltaproteobacteria bacterium CG03_land_8_20_14_0_80_45_14]|nr:MAG: hypothetical protein COS40_02490 [Deltaproteobacteria bacterium CG03_land_8_20_14_0_80_45_14]